MPHQASIALQSRFTSSLLIVSMSSQLLEISKTALISVTQSSMSSELPGEAIILNLDSGVYFGLDEVGARIWALLSQKPQHFSDLHRCLLEEYEVDSDTCEQDLTELLLAMKSASLIEVCNEGA